VERHPPLSIQIRLGLGVRLGLVFITGLAVVDAAGWFPGVARQGAPQLATVADLANSVTEASHGAGVCRQINAIWSSASFPASKASNAHGKSSRRRAMATSRCARLDDTPICQPTQWSADRIPP